MKPNPPPPQRGGRHDGSPHPDAGALDGRNLDSGAGVLGHDARGILPRDCHDHLAHERAALALSRRHASEQ